MCALGWKVKSSPGLEEVIDSVSRIGQTVVRSAAARSLSCSRGDANAAHADSLCHIGERRGRAV